MGDHRDKTDRKEAGQIDLEGIEGRMQASTWRRIERLLEQHPERFAAVLRNWIHEDKR